MRQLMTAVYTGTETSLGFRKGQTYGLIIETEFTPIRRMIKGWRNDWNVVITAPETLGYTDWFSFKEDWTQIEEVAE